MKTTSRKILSLLLSCALLCALVVAAPVTAQAATTYINTPGDWPAGGSINLFDGDVLAIGSGAGSPSVATVINIVANANVTINGNGVMIDNLRIAESVGDTVAHTVTISNLKITAPSGNSAYAAGQGVVNLIGTNEFDGCAGMQVLNVATGATSSMTFTSSSGGTITLRGNNTPVISVNNFALNIQGNATVNAYGGTSNGALSLNTSSGVPTISIARDATLNAVSGGISQGGISSGGGYLTIANSGVLNVTGGSSGQAFGTTGFLVMQMAAGATTTLTNNSISVESHSFSTSAVGSTWILTGATFDTGSTASDNPANISVAAGSTGTIKLVTPVSALSVAAIANQVYTGAALKPVPVIKDGSKTLVNGTDFTLAYANNTAVGTATITVTGIGAYAGTRSVNFKIVPATPVLASLANSTTGPLLKWNKAAGATGYYVMRKTGTGAWVNIKKITAATTLSYTDTTAVSGTAYAYSVQAYGGTSSLAGSYNTTGLKVTYVATPKLTSAVNAATGVKFTWGKVSGATGYLIYRKTGTGAWVKVKTITAVSTVTWTDTAVKTGTTYTYTAKAYKTTTTNVSAYNTTGIKRLYVAMPKLTSLKNSKSGPVLKWGKITGATGYLIYRKLSGGVWVKVATITKVGTLTWTDKAAANKKTYYYTIRAYKTSSTVTSTNNATGWKITVKK